MLAAAQTALLDSSDASTLASVSLFSHSQASLGLQPLSLHVRPPLPCFTVDASVSPRT